MKRSYTILGLLLSITLGSACDAGEGEGDDGSDTGSSTGDASTFGTSTSSGSDGPAVSECDPFGEPCADGLKCMPYDQAPVTKMWDTNGCFPVSVNAALPGSACTVYESAVDGIDSCAVGSMCMPADFEDLAAGGTCLAFCEGSREAPSCASPEQTCIIANEGVLNLCLEMCDPVMQNCADGEGCYLNPTDNKFFCFQQDEHAATVPSGFADACGTLNFCDPGLQCDEATKVPGCESEEYCCTEFCDLSEPNADEACSGYEGGQRCLPHFGDGQAPPGFEDIGLCANPQ